MAETTDLPDPQGSEVTGAQSYCVIVENDETKWHDSVGVSYHYPRRYRKSLKSGTRLIHYKGRMTNTRYATTRLSDQAHYFATSLAGQSVNDPQSAKGDLFVDILGFTMFDAAVSARDGSGNPFEVIPSSRVTNFWRDGVRPTTEDVVRRILDQARLSDVLGQKAPAEGPDGLTSMGIEGGKKKVYSTKYERRPELRREAIRIHGVTCFACERDLKSQYGELAAGHIHIHHRRPLSSSGETLVDPGVDLVPLCPNCHSIVHLGGGIRTVNEVRGYLGKPPIVLGD